MAAALISSIAMPSMTTLTPGGRAVALTMPGAESIPFLGSTGVFDPLGLTPESKEELLMFREAELAHGRVAMMGALGYLVQSHFAPMFDMADAPVIRHLDLVLKTAAGQLGATSLLIALFFSEIYRGARPPPI